MRSRRVPVLRLGSRGPGGDARSLRLWTQAFASVRRRPQASASVRKRSRSVGLLSDLCRTCVGLAGDKNCREMQNCRHFLRFVLQTCQQSQGSGESWSRNAELSSLLDSSRVFASQKCQQSNRDRGGPGRETQNCRHFWTCLGSSRLNSVNSHRDRGGPGRETQNCRHFWPCLWREERKEERGEKRDEKREERREERRETRGERGKEREERREERREKRGQRIEDGRKRGEEREVRR